MPLKEQGNWKLTVRRVLGGDVRSPGRVVDAVSA
jgi:hypothetical protein